jgi:hypothetical protein
MLAFLSKAIPELLVVRPSGSGLSGSDRHLHFFFGSLRWPATGDYSVVAADCQGTVTSYSPFSRNFRLRLQVPRPPPLPVFRALSG